MRCWNNSQRQLFDCLQHRFAELVQALSFQSSTEEDTDLGALPPKFNAILLVNHPILEPFQHTTYQQRTRRRRTLIEARRKLAEAKTSLACGITILEASFARSKVRMNPFNTEMVRSCPLGCWVLAFMDMVETRGGCERVVRWGGSEGSEILIWMRTRFLVVCLVRTGPFSFGGSWSLPLNIEDTRDQ